MNIVHIGELAHAALTRSEGVALPIPMFEDSPYLDAAGEVIWVGARIPALHPRAVITDVALPRGVALRFGSIPREGWSAQLPDRDAATAERIVSGIGMLRGALLADASPRGFGALLARATPPFPLDVAAGRVHSLTQAYRRDDCEAVFAASVALLGIGTGMTPSGDDLAGAGLFGKKFVAPDNDAWRDVAERLCREVGMRSHVVSAALFRDLARGQSFAPLHALADALARGDDRGAIIAAKTLAAIGHSSGWDMITGFIIGATGRLC